MLVHLLKKLKGFSGELFPAEGELKLEGGGSLIGHGLSLEDVSILTLKGGNGNLNVLQLGDPRNVIRREGSFRASFSWDSCCTIGP